MEPLIPDGRGALPPGSPQVRDGQKPACVQGMPSRDPADDGFAGMLRTVFNKLLQNVDGCLPARVISYDRKKNVATVQPIIQLVAETGENVSRAAVASVPVLALGGGEFFINFPLKPGDLGWIVANDRDISHYKERLAEVRPNTFRKKSFEDGLFVPDILRNYTIAAEDLDANMVIQHRDGKVRVAVWPDRVKVSAKADTWLEVNSDGTITGTAGDSRLKISSEGTITGTAPLKVFFDTPLVEFAGVFRSGVGGGGGESLIGGTLRSTGDQIAGGVSTMHHTHPGIQPGNGNTAEPAGGS